LRLTTGSELGNLNRLLFIVEFERGELGENFNRRAQITESFGGSQSTSARAVEFRGVLIYFGLIAVYGMFAFSQSFLFAQLCNHASTFMHERLLSRLLRAPMRFFQINTPGRVLNRIVNDMGTVDEFIQLYYRNTLRVMSIIFLNVLVLAHLFSKTCLCDLLSFIQRLGSYEARMWVVY